MLSMGTILQLRCVNAGSVELQRMDAVDNL